MRQQLLDEVLRRVVVRAGVAPGGGRQAEEQAGLEEDEKDRVDNKKADEGGNPIPEVSALDQVLVFLPLRIQGSPPSTTRTGDSTGLSLYAVCDGL